MTPWSKFFLDKLTGLQVVKNFSKFHGIRSFITTNTSFRNLSLSWANTMLSIYQHLTPWRSVHILSTHLRLGFPVFSFPPFSPPRPYISPSPHPYPPHVQPKSFLSILSPAKYLVRCTNYLTIRYSITLIPPLPRPS